MHLVGKLVSKLALNLLIISAVAFVLAASAASAQVYPPDADEVDVGTDDPTPEPGEDVELHAHVADENGNDVEGAEVEFTLTSNPGTARFANGEQSMTDTTDENGDASVVLNTGDDPGTIVVQVDAAGVISQITMTTGEPQALPPTGGTPDSPGGVPATALAAVVGLALLAATVICVRKLA